MVRLAQSESQRDRGSMVARDLGAEFLRIVSGTRRLVLL